MGTVRLQRGEKCGVCGNRYLRNIAVDGLAVSDGKVLLIKRGNEPDRGKWALPGGLLDWDEDAEEAVLREFSEEAGLSGRVGKFLGVYSDPRRDTLQRVTVVYEVLIIGGVLQFGDDALEAKWFALDELPRLAFDHNRIVEDYLRVGSKD
ncbi:MAG: hypothetical protein A2900_06135 [Candidatus Chisholmbacteria bacterium RIFCSPLOWO2_01_FULL_50_28]|uniref:Nudix hydrolase domain-containing protein n=1 Tax=Candidatus Chisholmbacteria bacterium RIFCSPHIGHO2_01_FULL_52_32 TaxID=1797591 RepID=A0A1G1VQW8_9BACT|nr:MAG: hypothetical protein A2786_00510 [Candidatus Chisholmbacteria bacterium RIFCSPHIGHO2_01_FULL_52_32]OGY20692.1 MAG: hypothetical protein A2900_06135 [Candidatus Chisholmbacteria bacterium RIFCSPLOWO2_01_FULL_50_28]